MFPHPLTAITALTDGEKREMGGWGQRGGQEGQTEGTTQKDRPEGLRGDRKTARDLLCVKQVTDRGNRRTVA